MPSREEENYKLTNAHPALASQPTLSLPFPTAGDLKVPRRLSAGSFVATLCQDDNIAEKVYC